MSLLDDLETEAAKTRPREYRCSACEAIRAVPDPATREALGAALGGTMGQNAVLRLSAKHNLGIGRDGLLRHRDEGHQP